MFPDLVLLRRVVVSSHAAGRSTRHRGACLGVDEGHDVVRIIAPRLVASGVRSISVKDTRPAMVKLATSVLVGNCMVSHPITSSRDSAERR